MEGEMDGHGITQESRRHGITQLLQGFKKIFKTNLGLKGPIIFGRIGTNMVKQEFFWIKKTIFCI